MRAFTVQRITILALHGLGYVIGAPRGSTQVQQRFYERASIEPYHYNENPPLLASVQERGDGDKGKKPSVNVPSSKAPSNNKKFKPKPEEFNPFDKEDSNHPNYPYNAARKGKPQEFGGKSYTVWDITKGDEENQKHIDTIGIANGGKDLMIKSATNSEDPLINGDKASLAELIFALYKHKVEANPNTLTTIRIQEVKEDSTWDVMSDLHKAMNKVDESDKPDKPKWVEPKIPEEIKDEASKEAWLKKKKNEWRKQQSKAPKNKPTPKPSQQIFEFQLNDKQNPDWYNKIKASKWGASVEKINTKFNKKLTHIDANTESKDESYLIFYLE